MDAIVQRIQTALEMLSRNLEQEISEKVKAPITKPQFMLLYTINTYKKCRLSQLAEKMEVKPSAITVMIDRLERENFVKRIDDPDDRRAVIVSLTEKGKEVLVQVLKDWNDVLKQYLADFSKEEVITFVTLLEKLAWKKSDSSRFIM